MNIFNLDIEQIDLEESRTAFSVDYINKLPEAPPFLSKKECAAILGVSIKVINHLIESGQLPFTDMSCDATAHPDLFGELAAPPGKTYILRDDLSELLEKALLCHKPVLTLEQNH